MQPAKKPASAAKKPKKDKKKGQGTPPQAPPSSPVAAPRQPHPAGPGNDVGTSSAAAAGKTDLISSYGDDADSSLDRAPPLASLPKNHGSLRGSLPKSFPKSQELVPAGILPAPASGKQAPFSSTTSDEFSCPILPGQPLLPGTQGSFPSKSVKPDHGLSQTGLNHFHKEMEFWDNLVPVSAHSPPQLPAEKALRGPTQISSLSEEIFLPCPRKSPRGENQADSGFIDQKSNSPTNLVSSPFGSSQADFDYHFPRLPVSIPLGNLLSFDPRADQIDQVPSAEGPALVGDSEAGLSPPFRLPPFSCTPGYSRPVQTPDPSLTPINPSGDLEPSGTLASDGTTSGQSPHSPVDPPVEVVSKEATEEVDSLDDFKIPKKPVSKLEIDRRVFYVISTPQNSLTKTQAFLGRNLCPLSRRQRINAPFVRLKPPSHSHP